MIKSAENFARMSAYQLADTRLPEGVAPVFLAQNESLRPPSPYALDAGAKAVQDAALYPDPDWRALREALAARHGIPWVDILIGSGSLDLIAAIARVFAGPGRRVLFPVHAYPFFKTAALMAGSGVDVAAETALTADVDALLAAVRPETSVVFLANPANPTGTRLPRSELLRLRAGLRDDILLVIDEAYGEFADHLGEPNWSLPETGTTILLRTFSKAYGLAGLRVGWALCPPQLADDLRKALNPNNISGPAQAMALAALQDDAYMRETCALTQAARDAAAETLRAAGVSVIDSHTNFLLTTWEYGSDVADMLRALKAQGVVLREQSGVGLPAALRLTIGPPGAMDKVLSILIRHREILNA